MKRLRKLLIKDSENTGDPQVRFRYGTTAGIIGIISNAVLFAGKLAVGIIGASITVIADAVNNISDAGSSAVTVIGFKLSSRPADNEHPFGHARYENITALIVALIVLIIGVLLCKSSIEKIITPEAVTVSIATYIVLAAAIVIKIWQTAVYLDFGKAIGSEALKASAADSRNDVIATSAVLIATIIIDTTGVNIDGYMGVAVSVFIIISSIRLVLETINPLLGTKADPALVQKIRKKIMSYDGVIGVHDLVIHSYGAANCFAIAHVEVPANVPVMTSHDLIDNIEHDFMRELNIKLNIHMDPVDTEDEECCRLRDIAAKAIAELNPQLTLHDFRIVRGDTHTNVLFDVVIPFNDKTTVAEVKERVEKAFEGDGVKYYLIIDTDRSSD